MRWPNGLAHQTLDREVQVGAMPGVSHAVLLA